MNRLKWSKGKKWNTKKDSYGQNQCAAKTAKRNKPETVPNEQQQREKNARLQKKVNECCNWKFSGSKQANQRKHEIGCDEAEKQCIQYLG